MPHVPSTNWKATNKATWSCFILSSHLFLSVNPCWAAPGLLVDCPSKGLARLFHGLLAQHLAGLKLQMSKAVCMMCTGTLRFTNGQAIVFEDQTIADFQSLSVPMSHDLPLVVAPAEQRYRLSLLQWLWLWRSPEAFKHPWEIRGSFFRVQGTRRFDICKMKQAKCVWTGQNVWLLLEKPRKTLTEHLHIPSSNI